LPCRRLPVGAQSAEAFAGRRREAARASFGPLNKEGGERRLNVAVTRARRGMLVASSMRAHDLDLCRSSARGVELLRAYLDYAERGTEALREAVSGAGGP
jgi:superfamily I DNA and/or RNA helicase